jgi:acyl carrier protein
VTADTIGEARVQNGSITVKIRAFLNQHFPMTKNVSDETPLLGSGLIDSLGILEVVGFLEKEFGMTITDEELLPENFGSVHALNDFVNSKRKEL